MRLWLTDFRDMKTDLLLSPVDSQCRSTHYDHICAAYEAVGCKDFHTSHALRSVVFQRMQDVCRSPVMAEAVAMLS